MKKTSMIITILGMCILTGCSNQKQTPTEFQETTTESVSETTTEIATEETTEETTEITTEEIPIVDGEIKLGETITNSFMELSTIKVGTGSDGGVISLAYAETAENETVIYLKGTLKNLDTEPANVWYNGVQFKFDDRYSYYGYFFPMKDSTECDFDNIPALSSRDIYAFAIVPNEILDTFTNCTLTIGICDKFAPYDMNAFDWKSAYDNTTLKYSINFTADDFNN